MPSVNLTFSFLSKKTKAVSIHSTYEKLIFHRPESGKDSLMVVFTDNNKDEHVHHLPITTEHSIETGFLQYNAFYLMRESRFRGSQKIKVEIKLNVLK